MAVHTDYKPDEGHAHTTRISVRVGTIYNHLQEVEVVELQEPGTGWSSEDPLKLVRTFLLQVAVTQTTSRAATRDTHLRQVRVFSPVVTRTVSSA